MVDLKALAKVVEKEIGEGSALFLSDLPATGVSTWIPTGSFLLDLTLGGGVPCGRLTVIVGDPFAGKTTLLCHMIANAQRKGYSTVLIETEYSLFLTERGSLG